MISVKVFRFLAIDCKEVCLGIIGPQGFEEFFERGLETISQIRNAVTVIE